jgi:anti-anti-sigma regulatory factor
MSTPPVFDLPAELTIYTAQETRDAMQAWLGKDARAASVPLRISAEAVEAVDGAGLQLLAALAPMSVEWRVERPSAAFALACRLMGLDAWLPADGAAGGPGGGGGE